MAKPQQLPTRSELMLKLQSLDEAIQQCQSQMDNLRAEYNATITKLKVVHN